MTTDNIKSEFLESCFPGGRTGPSGRSSTTGSGYSPTAWFKGANAIFTVLVLLLSSTPEVLLLCLYPDETALYPENVGRFRNLEEHTVLFRLVVIHWRMKPCF